MICKILVPIIIAISFLQITAAKNPSVLDISNYTVPLIPGQPPPKKYSIVKFISSSTEKATSVYFGPIKVWDGASSNRKVDSVDLEIVHNLPQLVTIHTNDGTSVEKLYFKWENGSFISESEPNYLSYQTIIKEEDTLLDYTVYLDIRKEPNAFAFIKEKKEIAGFNFDVIKAKSYFNFVGIFYESTMIFKHNEIESVDILKISSGPRLLIVKIPKENEPKRFIYENGWQECDEAKAQHFLNKLISGVTIPTQPKEPQQTSPSKRGELVYTTLQSPLPLPEVFSNEQLSSMNLLKQSPIIPYEFVPATCPNPHLIQLDLNAVPSEFIPKSEFAGNFTVTTLITKEGYNVSQIVESGIPVWTNTRSSKFLELIVYEKKNFALLLILKTNRSGEKTEYYFRQHGKFKTCNEYSFRQLFIEWTHTDRYDKSISYTLYGPNNSYLYKEIHKLVDGVHFQTVHPHDTYNFMRIVNGSNELVKDQDEQWKTFTITHFNSTHKLISLNAVKNDKPYVRYFKCVGTFSEVDKNTHYRLFHQYKSQIHIQSEILFDLKKQNAGYTMPIEYSTELSPLSGFHVKMVKIGDFVLWKSQKARCTSVLMTTPEALNLVKLNINLNDSLSQEYFRIFTNKAFKIQTTEEYEFAKKKYLENLKNPNSEQELSNLVYDVNLQYNLLVFDSSQPNKSVVTHTATSSPIIATTYGPKDGYVFGEIRYGQKVLWKTTSVHLYCTKFVLYFYNTEPRLGLFYLINNKNASTEYFNFTGPNPVALDKAGFDNKYNELMNAVNMTQIQSVGYKTVLDLLNFENCNANGTRKNGLFSVEYTHKEKEPIQMVLFGYEILWSAKENEGASKVLVIYYEMQPVVLQLTMNDESKSTKYLSHFNSLWHTLDPNLLEAELNNIAALEPHRRGFTLPELNETTEYDEGSTREDFFTAKKFLSKEGLVTTILDGRNRLHTPDPLNFVESLLLYYHGSNPRLLSFREKNLFGYFFDHHFVFSNGWRKVSFAKFEQLFNFYKTRPPKDLCSKNQFAFDITRADSRVSTSRLVQHHFGFKYTINDDQYSFCSVKTGNMVIWTSPRKKTLRTFYVYFDGSSPKLAKFDEEDSAKQVEEIYVQLEGNQWTEVDESVFRNALASLTHKYFTDMSPVHSPPPYVPEEQPSTEPIVTLPPGSPKSSAPATQASSTTSQPTSQPTPTPTFVTPAPTASGSPKHTGSQSSKESKETKPVITPYSVFETPSTAPSLKDIIMIPDPTSEAFVSPSKKQTVTPGQPGSITASALPSETSKQTPRPTTFSPPIVSQESRSPSPRTSIRVSPRPTGQAPILPAGSVTLDVLGPEDRNKFRYGTGHCDRVVPFKEFKPRTGFHIRMVSAGDKVAWHTESDSYVCTAVKVFLKDGAPILMELLIKDSIKKTSKYLFSFFDEDKWTDCDQDMFDATLDSLVVFYVEKSAQS